jgi:hypothetical protein
MRLSKTGLVVVLCLAFSLALMLPAESDAPSSDARYFLGSWKCGESLLTFAPLQESDTWLRLTYSRGAPEGTAVVGYVAGLHAWVFRDFHSDGAYADMSSPGPSDGRWEWTGPYYPQEGGPPLGSRITYVERSPTRFERTFELLRDDAYVPTGNDACMKVTQ